MIPKITGLGNTRIEALSIGVIVALIGLAALGLWQLSALQNTQKSQLIIHTENEASTTPVSTVY